MVTRKINWISSLDIKNKDKLSHLEARLANFYRSDKNYYQDIDATANNWIDSNERGYVKLLEYSKSAKSICEFGCGNANILKYNKDLLAKYSGCDFSEALLNSNRKKYPEANFKAIEIPNQLPFNNNEFDLVFSVFVLEHCCRPEIILQECTRILVAGGRLVLFCPDFLGRGKMSSQRSGFSEGTSRSKLAKGRYFDAALTLFDNRIRIPLYCWWQRKKANGSPKFLINISPTVFEDPFIADVDAVYLTYKKEIINFLSGEFQVEENTDEMRKYEKEKGLLFLSLRKKNN
jgi:SAM-dependent methyltransferase